MSRTQKRPSYRTGFARCASKSAYPKLWKGLVGAWCPSLGPSGDRLLDWSGRQNHGTLGAFTLSSAWSVVAGVPCLTGSGGSQAVSFSATSMQTPNVTVSLWLYRNGSQGAFAFPLGVSDGGNTGWRIYGNTSSLAFSYNVYNDAATQISLTIPNQTWAHLFATYDGATIKYAVRYNGGMVSGTKASSTPISYSGVNGIMFNRGGWGPFTGSIADVMVSSRAYPEIVGQKIFELGPGGIFTPRQRTIFGVTGTVATPWLYARRQQQIIGGGLGV